MHAYWVEGAYRSARGVKKIRTGGKSGPGDLEPYGKNIWAASPEEALRLATAELAGGEWVDGPRISPKSEEQRMRSLGAPELPGFTQVLSKRKGKSR